MMSEQIRKPIRILHVLGGTGMGGAESRIMDLYRNMNREEIQFDFMVHNQTEDYYNDEIRRLGGHIYRMPRFRLYNRYAYCSAWKTFFREHHEFRAVHGHMTSTAALYLPLAKRYGVPMTIAHARSAGTDPGLKGIATKLLRRSLAKKADYCFSCSKEAAAAVFGEKAVRQGKVHMIPNAIEVDRFLFHTKIREEMRQKYQVEEKLVIGHAGRFHYAKNHAFLLEIFSEIIKKEPKAVLLLVGEGPLLSSVREKARELQIEDRIIFTGNQTKIADYYQMMDYLVFPSRFEGLPGTVVEAQAAGLRCIISDTITREVIASELVHMESIQRPAAVWADYVLNHCNYTRTTDTEELKKKGFDVTQQVLDYAEFYKGNKSKV